MKHLYVLFTLCVIMGSLSLATPSEAVFVDPLTTVELEMPVHFISSDGRDQLVEAGVYSVEPAEEWIRLLSNERKTAWLIEAKQSRHELELDEAMAMSVPGESEDEQDNHYVLLLLPGGESLEATGTYSGVRTRGIFKKTFNRMKKTANRNFKKARSKAKSARNQAFTQAGKAKKSVRAAALNTKRHIEQTARNVASKVTGRKRKIMPSVSGGTNQWTKWSKVASSAARQEARNWFLQVSIDSRKCKVMAVKAIGTPGVLKSGYSFKGLIKKALKAAGASKTIAQGWNQAFEESWKQWARFVMIPGLPFYPSFAAFPGPQAPPIPNVPVPLSTMPSSKLAAMSPPQLNSQVLSRIGQAANAQDAKHAVMKFATDVGGRFAQCMASCMLINVMGAGPVPTFAPPVVMAGPVTGGTCRGGFIPAAAGIFRP